MKDSFHTRIPRSNRQLYAYCNSVTPMRSHASCSIYNASNNANNLRKHAETFTSLSSLLKIRTVVFSEGKRLSPVIVFSAGRL